MTDEASFFFPPDLLAAIRACGEGPDGEIDLAGAALCLAAVNYPGLSLERYRHHVSRLAADTGARWQSMRDGAAFADTPAARNEALRHVLCETHGYAGDTEKYDDLQNADLIRVIDRRKGMPISLSILYLHAARAQGWDARGLNFPGHFIVRLEREGERLIVDPFGGCAVLQAPDLRRLAKAAMGPGAELSASFYEPATNRAVLIRLQNNIKTRLIEAEDYEGALRAVVLMRLVDPQEYRLLLDEGVLCARTGRPREAAAALEAYIDRAPQARDRHDAAMLLQQIRQLLR